MAVSIIQSGADAASKSSLEGPDLAGYLLTCGFILALVLGAAWLFRRFLAGKIRMRTSGRSLRVIDVLPMGSRQRLVVVRCYDRTFLLGQGDKEIRAISEIDGAPETDLIPQPTEHATPSVEMNKPAQRAADVFARMLGRKGAGPSGSVALNIEVNDDVPLIPLESPASPVTRVAVPPPGTVKERPEHPVLQGGKGILG
ncbi:MAG: flagellar biosynthetic protein FliO [Planctomycetota bacterium]|jgi:flagellar biosynthetic protein FliO